MKEKIIALIEETLFLPEGTIKENTLIEDIQEWDSLAHILIIGQLEEKLGITISLEEAIEIAGVEDILKKAGV